MTEIRKPEADYELYPLGEQAVVIRWEGGINVQTRHLVRKSQELLERNRPAELVELVAAYRTVTVYYDPVALYLKSSRSRGKGTEDDPPVSPYEWICRWIHTCLQGLQQEDNKPDKPGDEMNEVNRVTVIPVCFGGSCGPDLDELALRAGMRPEEAIDLYCSVTYFVHMVGFLPGFPYLGGLPERLAAPRRSVPRMEIPAGTVGIAGGQTGIYPMASPGGWQLIGRTPVKLFDASRTRPSLLGAGDFIRFEPVSEAEFARLLT
ncbi:MAG: kinase inhibitor [Paenibacillus sp.]|nr:kinase inhibitor [Paenibacillus sp.]